MPCRVREGLFIGDIKDAAEVLQKGSKEITHVLSLLSSTSISFFSEWKPSVSISTQEVRKVLADASGDGSASGDVQVSGKKLLPPGKLLCSHELAGPELKVLRMAVPLKDIEDEDLLDYLDVCLDFIDEGRKKGSVLVHCFAGVSRSAAVVTAYLMKTEQKSLEDALQSLGESCATISPNDGFLDQLKMFEDMGFKVDPQSPIYKCFRMKGLGDSYNRGYKIDSSIFGADPGAPQSKSSETPPKQSGQGPAYRCMKCRRVVAVQENVVGHTPGKGEACFGRSKRSSGLFDRRGEAECSSIFIEPLRWMTTVEEGGMEGKLSCVHCGARLGYFNWAGIQCSCGSWITPAFQIHKSRIDVSTV